MASLPSHESLAPRKKKIIINRVEKPSEEHEELQKMAHDAVEEARSEEVFSSYICHSLKQNNVQKHPGDIVEAGCLAAQMLPNVSYNLFSSIPEEIIKSGKLSDLQLEGVVFACQRHQMVLANGQRAGFFIGDGAGVGKGRQIAGLILDSYARGRCKHIWFSISTDLRMDAQRDLADIGCFIKVIDGCQQLDRETKVFGLPSDFKEGIVFSTYSTLVSSVQRGSARQTRLQQLLDWCGGESFEGCLIFDECHKAKHFIPGKEESSTKVAVAVTTLQRMLPKARVLYCSATGVTDVKNMAFMERLGLWGEGTAFKTFDSFLDGITKRGLGASEMLAMEMKACGMYVSRGLSFRQAEFVTVEAPLKSQQIREYNTAVHVWDELRKSLNTALNRTNTATPRIWSLFWSCHQRFFKQLCMTMKVPKIVEEAKHALSNGYSVVIGLQTTGEASLQSELSSSGGTVSEFVSITAETLRRFISQYFPTQFQRSSTGELKNDDWCCSAKELLLSFVEKINLPISSLDDIIDQLGGPSCVAEMTGRRGRVVRTNQNSQPHYESRESDTSSVDSLNIQERNSFMNGTKLVSIISDAASTGISLHADLRADNQRRRMHLTIELPWSADKAVQQLGRSHRSNQSSGPIYKLVTTNLGGERRFAAAVAKRLQSLGALTKGDRRAATGADLSQFNFNTPYGRSALRNMYQAISMSHIFPGVSLQSVLQSSQTEKDYEFSKFNDIMRDCLVLMDLTDSSFVVKEKEAGDVSKFLNRILGLSVEKQNLIFAYFSECLAATTESAKREGRYNEGVTDVTGSSITMVGKPQRIFSNVDRGMMPTKLITLNIDRGIHWESALQRYDTACRGKDDGFYCSKREQKGRRLYLLAIAKGVASHLFTIIRPNTGLSPFEENKEDLHAKYMTISPEEAETGWRGQYERTAERCIHGVGCKGGITCRVGSRTTQMHILCGGIVPLLSTLELAVTRNAEKLGLSKSDRTLRVVRVELIDGQRLVGLRYPEVLIAEVTALLSEQKEIEAQLANQNGVLGVAVPSKPKREAFIEPETPINSRTLAKATTPPVTIKTFFKAKQKEANSDAENKSSCGEATKLSEFGPHKQEIESCTGKNDNMEEKIELVCLDNPRECSQSDFCKISAQPPRVQKAASIGSKTTKTKPSLKRSSSSLGGNSSKKCKQTNILVSFASANHNGRVSAVKDVKCPICALEFEKGTSNEELNKHIDNCLIE